MEDMCMSINDKPVQNESLTEQVKSESGGASHYAVEVIGLLGLSALIYATFALLLVS